MGKMSNARKELFLASCACCLKAPRAPIIQNANGAIAKVGIVPQSVPRIPIAPQERHATPSGACARFRKDRIATRQAFARACPLYAPVSPASAREVHRDQRPTARPHPPGPSLQLRGYAARGEGGAGKSFWLPLSTQRSGVGEGVGG